MKTGRYKLSELRDITKSGADVFLCSASYEERCKSVADNVDVSSIQMALVARNENHADINQGNFEYLSKKFNGRCSTLALHTDDPLQSADAFLTAARNQCVGAGKRWLVDITTFTHEGLLILLRVLAETIRFEDRVEFVYARAREYSLGDPPERKWLSKGIREVRSVLGYPGELLPSRRSHLIVLAGFEAERALALIQEYEPYCTSIGYGDASESGTLGHQQVNEAVVARLRHMADNVRTFVFPCYDAEGTSAAIKKQVESVQNCNTIIAPMNTKISTLGTACYALEADVVQLCYGQANLYNYQAYSAPGDECFHFSVSMIPRR